MRPAPVVSAEPAGVEPLDVVRILRSSGGALAAQALLHGRLARIEWEEEKNRLLRMMLIALLGFACLLCAMLLAGGLVLTAAWETAHRIPVAGGLVLLYAWATAIAWRHFQAQSALSGQSFAALREELAADMALLRSAL